MERGNDLVNRAELPDDPEALKSIILEQYEQLQDLKRQIEQLRRAQFGRSSERFVPPPSQLSLFGATSYPAELPPKPPPPEPRAKAPGHGRAKLPPHLKREKVVHDVSPEQKRCGCGKERRQIGTETAEQLEYTPANLKVLVHERPKYACSSCADAVVTAEPKTGPIAKGLPGPGLLAYVTVSKYADHLPLYRLEGIFERQGVQISRSTMADWIGQVEEMVGPIIDAMRKDLLESGVIQADDTPVPVQGGTESGTREGRLAVYRGDEAHPQVVFDYTPDKRNEHVVRFLNGYARWLQVDAYSGYDRLFRETKAVEVGCWAHARRRFYDAQGSEPAAVTALGMIRELYRVEEEAKDLEERHRRRQERSKPILADLRGWLESEGLKALPKSGLGDAVGYSMNQWGALIRYVEDPRLAIDNNAAERELRAVAVGRKNWLFAGSDEGGRRAAAMYSLVATCRRIGLEPFGYLRDLLTKLPDHPPDRMAELMPTRMKPLANTL